MNMFLKFLSKGGPVIFFPAIKSPNSWSYIYLLMKIYILICYVIFLSMIYVITDWADEVDHDGDDNDIDWDDVEDDSDAF